MARGVRSELSNLRAHTRIEDAEARRTVRSQAHSVRPLPSLWSTKAVGVSFQPKYPTNLQKLDRMVARAADHDRVIPVTLIREPDNEHDPNAVALRCIGIGMIGHLPREIAARLAPELDSGVKWEGEVEKVLIGQDPNQPGVSVTCWRVED